MLPARHAHRATQTVWKLRKESVLECPECNYVVHQNVSASAVDQSLQPNVTIQEDQKISFYCSCRQQDNEMKPPVLVEQNVP